MDQFQLIQRQRALFAFDIQHLSGTHTIFSRAPAELQRSGSAHFSGIVGGQNGLKGGSLEGVARQHRIRLTEHHMIGGLAPAQVVIVHTGQIVVNQRIGVQHLHAAAQRQRFHRIAAGGGAELHG